MPDVAFLSNDWVPGSKPLMPNGCTYYRMVLPAQQLLTRGWNVEVGIPQGTMEHGLGLAKDEGMLTGWDVYVLKLVMNQHIAAVIRSTPGRVIVDVDDFHFGLSTENVAELSTHPHRNLETNRAWYEQSIREADTVTVSTQFLADFYDTRVRDVRVVRNGIDIERWVTVQHPERPVIGWVGGTLWRSGDIELLREWLPAFAKDHGLTVFHGGHIPGDGRHFGVRAGIPRVQTRPQSTVSNYPSLFGMHIGLVPLNRVPFSEAKSNLKGLEYAASGIPFIATPTEEYRILYASGVGRLAETPDEWRDHATELLDPDVRAEEGARIRKIVETDWCMERRGPEWDSAIRS